jgi:tetratricopeptide (TPR) repeat protein
MRFTRFVLAVSSHNLTKSQYSRTEPVLNWLRALFSLILVPSIVVSCAAVPQAGTEPTQRQLVATTRDLPSKPMPPSDPRAYYHFILGYQAELERETDRAVREYQAALRGDPSSIFLKARLASLFFSIGDLNNAMRTADRITPSDVHDAPTLVLLAGIYAGGGQSERALRLYDQAIEQKAGGSDPYFSKGTLLLNLKRFTDAEHAFERGIEASKDSPVGYYYLGRIAVETKQLERAIVQFDRSIAVHPTFEPGYIALASVYEAQEDREKAAGVYRRYLENVNPNSKEIRQQLIRLFINSKSYEAALVELQKALAQDPSDLDAQLRTGLIYGELKQYRKAIEQLEKILVLRPAELKVRDYLGLMYEELKDFDQAIRAYQQNLSYQPNYVDGHMHMGFLFYRLKRYPDAIAHLADAIKLSPKHPDAHLLLGLTYLQTEQYTQASTAFEEGIRQNPENPDLHFNLGTAYDKLNRFEDVVKAMEAALRLDPKHADALNYLGYSYAERGIRIEEALSLIQRAVSLKPNNGYYVDSLGWAFFKKGMLSEALAEIQRAATLVKDDPVIFEHLGEIYLKQNRLDEAREAWLHSLELDPSNVKLVERFEAQGFGDPTTEERIRQAKQRVSQHAPSIQTPVQAIP